MTQANSKEITFEQGWAARPFKEQFPQLTDDESARLDAINKAISTLLFAGMLTDSQRNMIRQKKMPRAVFKVLREANKRQGKKEMK